MFFVVLGFFLVSSFLVGLLGLLGFRAWEVEALGVMWSFGCAVRAAGLPGLGIWGPQGEMQGCSLIFKVLGHVRDVQA